jgi:hypothetical protein
MNPKWTWIALYCAMYHGHRMLSNSVFGGWSDWQQISTTFLILPGQAWLPTLVLEGSKPSLLHFGVGAIFSAMLLLS